jgi:predicted Zn-dependent protease
MPRSRRTFLKDLSIAAGCGAVVHVIDGPFRLLGRIHAAQLGGDQFSSLAEEAFKAARELGCSYADILMNARRTGTVSVATNRNLVGVKSREPNRFTTLIENANFRLRARAIHSGAWGFVESPRIGNSDAASLMVRAVALARANADSNPRPFLITPVRVLRMRRVQVRHLDHLDALISEQMRDLQAAEDKSTAFRTDEIYFASSRGDYSCTTRLFRI